MQSTIQLPFKMDEHITSHGHTSSEHSLKYITELQDSTALRESPFCTDPGPGLLQQNHPRRPCKLVLDEYSRTPCCWRVPFLPHLVLALPLDLPLCR
ncbi:hypothetical protein MHYP_G00261740 [Metynnis hypsauchen]